MELTTLKKNIDKYETNAYQSRIQNILDQRIDDIDEYYLETLLQKIAYYSPTSYQNLEGVAINLSKMLIEYKSGYQQQKINNLITILAKYGLLNDYENNVKKLLDEQYALRKRVSKLNFGSAQSEEFISITKEIDENIRNLKNSMPPKDLHYIWKNASVIHFETMLTYMRNVIEPFLHGKITWDRQTCMNYQSLLANVIEKLATQPTKMQSLRSQYDTLLSDLDKACKTRLKIKKTRPIRLPPFPNVNSLITLYAGGSKAVYKALSFYLSKRHSGECVIYFRDYAITPYGITFNMETNDMYINIRLERTIQNCIDKRKRFIIIPLVILFDPGHAGMVIYDTQSSSVERFEPHGISSTPIIWFDKQLEEWFKSKFNVMSYYAPIDYCPVIGVQSLKSFSEWEETGKQNTFDYEGFCTMWSYWYADLRLTYSEIPRDQLIQKVTDLFRKEAVQSTAEQLKVYMAGFVTFAYNLSRMSNYEIKKSLEEYRKLETKDIPAIPSLLQISAFRATTHKHVALDIMRNPSEIERILKKYSKNTPNDYLEILIHMMNEVKTQLNFPPYGLERFAQNSIDIYNTRVFEALRGIEQRMGPVMKDNFWGFNITGNWVNTVHNWPTMSLEFVVRNSPHLGVKRFNLRWISDEKKMEYINQQKAEYETQLKQLNDYLALFNSITKYTDNLIPNADLLNLFDKKKYLDQKRIANNKQNSAISAITEIEESLKQIDDELQKLNPKMLKNLYCVSCHEKGQYVCGGCQKQVYCGQECAQQNWNQEHRKICNKIKNAHFL